MSTHLHSATTPDTDPSPATAIRPAVDTHTHAFTLALAMVDDRRYTPTADAPIEKLIATLDAGGLDDAVLVQPSFLGTDNSYLTKCIARHRERLRGVCVLAPDTPDAEFEKLSRAGIVAMRYNLVGQDPEMLCHADYRDLTRRAVAHGWHIELHIDGISLPKPLNVLLAEGATVVVDHFGRPVPGMGDNDPGLRELRTHGPDGPVWVKFSAPYRFCDDNGAQYAAILRDQLGPGRILWGSDWPWTRYETGRSYTACVDQFAHWLDNDPALAAASNHAARTRYGFAAQGTDRATQAPAAHPPTAQTG